MLIPWEEAEDTEARMADALAQDKILRPAATRSAEEDPPVLSGTDRMEAIFGRIRALGSRMPIDSERILTPDRRHLAQRVKNLMKTGDLIAVRKLVEKTLSMKTEEPKNIKIGSPDVLPDDDAYATAARALAEAQRALTVARSAPQIPMISMEEADKAAAEFKAQISHLTRAFNQERERAEAIRKSLADAIRLRDSANASRDTAQQGVECLKKAHEKEMTDLREALAALKTAHLEEIRVLREQLEVALKVRNMDSRTAEWDRLHAQKEAIAHAANIFVGLQRMVGLFQPRPSGAGSTALSAPRAAPTPLPGARPLPPVNEPLATPTKRARSEENESQTQHHAPRSPGSQNTHGPESTAASVPLPLPDNPSAAPLTTVAPPNEMFTSIKRPRPDGWQDSNSSTSNEAKRLRTCTQSSEGLSHSTNAKESWTREPPPTWGTSVNVHNTRPSNPPVVILNSNSDNNHPGSRVRPSRKDYRDGQRPPNPHRKYSYTRNGVHPIAIPEVPRIPITGTTSVA
ncbi:hypothetical protein R3P38DRAFT_2801294 [Favolaschia claudopus]|uniref:Uncharacterized protein n=1 Tax=Favolaschia claudopus TaxID=2862362 RepID=A0AAV9ZVI8_9AGAR